MIGLYRAGAVAEAFGLNVSTVRRLVRKHGARRKKQNDTQPSRRVHLGGLAACRTSE